MLVHPLLHLEPLPHQRPHVARCAQLGQEGHEQRKAVVARFLSSSKPAFYGDAIVDLRAFELVVVLKLQHNKGGGAPAKQTLGGSCQ